jgi:hypothetical protein
MGVRELAGDRGMYGRRRGERRVSVVNFGLKRFQNLKF